MIYEMDHIWTADMKSSEAMILTFMNAIFAIAQRSLKNSGLQRGWTHDLAKPDLVKEGLHELHRNKKVLAKEIRKCMCVASILGMKVLRRNTVDMRFRVENNCNNENLLSPFLSQLNFSNFWPKQFPWAFHQQKEWQSKWRHNQFKIWIYKMQNDTWHKDLVLNQRKKLIRNDSEHPPSGLPTLVVHDKYNIHSLSINMTCHSPQVHQK